MRLWGPVPAAAMAVAGLLSVAPPVAAQHMHASGQAADGCAGASPSLQCAATATPGFDAAGRLWLAWSQGGHVYVSRSDDLGASFAAPARVTAAPLAIDDNGENRPKVVAAGDVLHVSFTARGERKFTGIVYLATSRDGGRTFAVPTPVSDEAVPGSQRFEAMALGRDGRLHIAWIDKRDLFAAEQRQSEYRGAALYATSTADNGITLAPNRKVADHTCECCRLGMAMDEDDLPVVVWRHVFAPSLRDHALAKIGGSAAPMRVAEDQWAIDACPHHGPALSVAAQGVYHVAWYTDGAARQGLFHARSLDGGRSFTAPVGFGAGERQAAHPQVLARGDRVFLAWKEFDGAHTHVLLIQSDDGGASWTAPQAVAAAAGASDHPILVAHDGRAYLSWLSEVEGYRLLPVGEV